MVDHITIILCVIGMIIQCVFIYSEYRKNLVAALFLKGLASIFFVCVGIRGFVRTGVSPFAMKIVYGLVLGALGDIILNVRYLFKKYDMQIFTVGTVSFFAGHIMYLIAQIPLCDRLRASVVSGLIVSGVILVFMDKKLKLSLFYKLGGFLYVCSVAFMASVAVNNYISVQNISRGIYAFGAFFFLCSDVILIFNTFGKKKNFRLSALTLVLYYIGQISIAVSLFYI